MLLCRVVVAVAVVVLGSVAVRMVETAAADEPRSSAPHFPIETYQLSNGLKVALSHDPTAPRTTVCVAYHVGSKNERPGLTGFAHFFEHMMFRGTQNVPDFDLPLQQAGGSPNAFTSEDVTVYFETVPNNYLKRTLYMEAERMAFLSSALDQEKFDTEREVVKNERRQHMENAPYGLADETIASLVYPAGHPYSWSVIGSMKDLNNATLDDLRQFFYEFYHPGNATLTLVGGFDPREAQQWIETYFGPISRGPDLAPIQVPATPPVKQLVTQKDRVQFSRVYWTWPTVSETHPDAPALELLSMVLSSGDASRLMQSLVINSQVAVEVDASSETSEVGGVFTILATIAPGQTVDEVQQAIGQVVADVQAAPIPAEELARVRAKYRTGLLQRLTSPVQRTFVIALGLAQHDDPNYYQKLFTTYEAVAVEDLQRVARKYLVDQKVVLVVEPVGGDEAESEAVLAGPLDTGVARPELTARSHAPGPDWAQMPAATEQKPFVPPTFERRTLKNGLAVWLAPWRTLPLVSVRLLVRTGSADDPAAQAGLAALTAELWNQGTRELTSTQFAEAVDALGTSLDVSADTDTVVLGFTAETRALNEMLHLTGQMIAEPRFDAEDFQREQKLQLSSLASGPDDPSWIADRVFPTLLYGLSHPFASPELGYTETVEGLDLQQVRQFYRDHFVPTNATLVVVGDIDPDQVIAALDAQWSDWQTPPAAVQNARPSTSSATTTSAGTVYVVDKPGAVQSVIVVGRIWRDRKDPSYFATRVGNRVFGGDFLSRINQNLRQKNGFTYGAQSGFRYFQEGGRWALSTSVRTEVTGDALAEIVSELKGAATDRPLTADEVEVARSAEMSVFPQMFETPASIAGALAQLAMYSLPTDYYVKYLGQLESTKPEDASTALAHVADLRQIQMLVVGDRQAIEPLLTKAGFKNLKYLDSDGRPSE